MPVVDLVRRSPLLCYFALAFGLSGVVLTAIGLPELHHGAVRPGISPLMFAVMVVGVGLIGILPTAAIQRQNGIDELRSRLARPVNRLWWLVLVLASIAITGVLPGLQAFASRNFAAGLLVSGFEARTFADPGAQWYLAYAAVLWAVVIVVVALHGSVLFGWRRTGRRLDASSLSATARS